MRSRLPARYVFWALAALAVCVVLSLRDLAATAFVLGVDPNLMHRSAGEQVGWTLLYYTMWALLAPGVLALSRRVPFRREAWLRPLALHLGASVAIAACAPVALQIGFDAVIRAMGGGDLRAAAVFDAADFTWSSGRLQVADWARLAAYRAVADVSFYWVILAAEFAMHAYEEDQAQRQAAVDLERTLVAAQVESLKMKLQPHFLFNTLNSISFLAVDRDADAVVAMVERLGGLLRASTQVGGRHVVTVGEELALLDQYLAIEEVRFSDRLRIIRRVAPAATDALMPSLVLQPIVENSIKHGFGRRIDASRLEIGIRRDGDALAVTVEDDGPGMLPDWDLATQCGRGLKNVIERLETLYPGSWSFTLKNRPGGGAVSRLRIPWRRSE